MGALQSIALLALQKGVIVRVTSILIESAAMEAGVKLRAAPANAVAIAADTFKRSVYTVPNPNT